MREQLLKYVEFESGPQPTVAVIWLHGLGDSGHGFMPVVKQLNLKGCPPIRFILPHAPSMPVKLNGGYVMPAWYDVGGTDIVKSEDEVSIRASQKLIEQLIEQEKARGIPASRIVLAGFSQGCAMALQVGLRHPEKLAGIIGLSGYLPLGHTVATERHAANTKTPIFLAHGRLDDVIPLLRAEQSRDFLSALGYRIDWREYRMAHNVIEHEIDDISAWLEAILNK